MWAKTWAFGQKRGEKFLWSSSLAYGATLLYFSSFLSRLTAIAASACPI
jgi:hypothetical protein